jgi:CRISPR-associated endoribonuclease Cas6
MAQCARNCLRLTLADAAQSLAFADLAFWLRRPGDFEEHPDLPDRIRGALGRRLVGLSDGAGAAAHDAATLHGMMFGRRDDNETARPFVIHTDVKGERIKVVVRLFGAASNYWASLEAAIEAACMTGIALKQGGRQRLRFEILKRECCAAPSWEIPSAPARATLLFGTPVALREGRQTRPSLRGLPVNAARRLKALLAWQGAAFDFRHGDLARASRGLLYGYDELFWARWSRRSSSTGADGMPLGGFMGALRVSGDIEAVWPLLCAGALTHVGSGAALGLGRYDLLAGV